MVKGPWGFTVFFICFCLCLNFYIRKDLKQCIKIKGIKIKSSRPKNS